MKKKLCILQNGLARGGTDTFVVNLCRGLDKKKFDITVVNPSDKPGSVVREPEVIAAGAKIIHTTRLSGIKGQINHLRQLYKILKTGEYDIFQTNIDLFNGPNLLVAKLAGVPIRCCHSHNGMQNKETIKGKTLPVRLYQSAMRWMCKKYSNRQCGCSEIAMDFLYPNMDWRKSEYPTIINNGIDLDFYRQKIDRTEKLTELNLPTDKKYLLTIGHLIEQKNPTFIAEIFSALSKKRNNVDLIWVGNGKLKGEVLKILEKGGVTNRVHFLENRTDLNEIMHCAELFIFPSLFEGLGIVAIEAQAAGLPCLLADTLPIETDCGGALYLPINSGETVWVNYINNILDGKIRLSSDDSKLEKFSIQYMTEQMTQVFEYSK